MDAKEFAKKVHDASGRTRKLSGLPYFTHPEGVADILRYSGCSEEVVSAGYLHDTVEDAGVTIEQIKELFGDRVAELVAGASEPEKGASWVERKTHTLDYLRNCEDQDLLKLVLADKLDNLRDTHYNGGPGIWEKFNAGFELQKWYYNELLRIFIRKIPDFFPIYSYMNAVEAIFFNDE